MHENPALSPVEKFQYLTGDAVTIISSYQLTGDLYAPAYGALYDRYNNKRRLAQLYIDKLVDFPKQHHSSGGQLQHFLSIHTTAINSFKTLNLSDSLDYVLFHLSVVIYLSPHERLSRNKVSPNRFHLLNR